MTAITITRIHSGFANVADSYALGIPQDINQSLVGNYILPPTYMVSDGELRDPDGILCMVDCRDGTMTAISMAGARPDAALRVAC